MLIRITGGTSGLEAAPVDQSTGIVQWCFGFEDLGFEDIAGVVNLPSADTPDPNSGAHNTPKIIEEPSCGATSAAGVAAAYVWPEGQTDGFLPNKEELNLLYAQRDIVGGFASGIYWSSSEFDNYFAWNQSFGNGVQSAFSKSAEHALCACCPGFLTIYPFDYFFTAKRSIV